METIHEGTTSVKRSKLQRLTSAFETLFMRDEETFDDFYAKLSDIVNSCFTLGEKIPEAKIVGKILRSLPERFQPKMTAIEEAQNVDTLKLDQLVGNLQTYEAHQISKKKQKESVAFTSAHESAKTPETEFDLESEMTAMFTKHFKKKFEEKEA